MGTARPGGDPGRAVFGEADREGDSGLPRWGVPRKDAPHFVRPFTGFCPAHSRASFRSPMPSCGWVALYDPRCTQHLAESDLRFQGFHPCADPPPHLVAARSRPGLPSFLGFFSARRTSDSAPVPPTTSRGPRRVPGARPGAAPGRAGSSPVQGSRPVSGRLESEGSVKELATGARRGPFGRAPLRGTG